MDIYQFSALPILDEEKMPVAVLTEGDIARAIVGTGGLIKIGEQPAMQIATRDPICEFPETEISDALHKMLSSGLTLLPVIEDGAMIGLVFRIDLMQALLTDAHSLPQENS